MEIFEDSRKVSRADLAAWLRQLAGQLESDGKVLFGAAGSVTVSDEVDCEFEIESSGAETSIEIEFTWTGVAAAAKAKASDAEEDEDDEEGLDEGDSGGDVEDAEETAAERAGSPPTGVAVAPAAASDTPDASA